MEETHHLLSVANSETIYTDIQVSLWYTVIETFEHILRSGIVRLHDSSVFKVWGIFLNFFLIGLTLISIVATPVKIYNNICKCSLISSVSELPFFQIGCIFFTVWNFWWRSWPSTCICIFHPKHTEFFPVLCLAFFHVRPRCL